MTREPYCIFLHPDRDVPTFRENLRQQIITSCRRDIVTSLAKTCAAYDRLFIGYIHQPCSFYGREDKPSLCVKERIIPVFFERCYGVIVDYGTTNGSAYETASMFEVGSNYYEVEPTLYEHRARPRITVYDPPKEFNGIPIH